MKTFFILLLAFALAMPMPQGKDNSKEESSEVNKDYGVYDYQLNKDYSASLGKVSDETSEDLQELEGNEDFVITSSCFVEATDGDDNLDEQTLENCVQCFEDADALGEEALAAEAAKNCTVEHLPNFYEDCKDGIESPTVSEAEVLEC